MAHLIAYVGNEPERLGCALFSARGALYSRGNGKRHGWALGFVQHGDVLLQKRPRADAAEVDIYALAHDLKADALVARVGFDHAGAASAENADPFRYRSWLFGSVGSVPGFEAIRDKMVEATPDFLRRNIRGKSASEHLFHLFLAKLHEDGILDQQSPDPRRVRHALWGMLSFTNQLIQTHAGGQADPNGHGLEVALVATTGRCLVATAASHPLQYLRVEGIADCPICQGRANPEAESRPIAHDALRAVIIEANPEAQGRAGWRPVHDRTAILVGPDRVAQVVPLADE